MPSLRALTSTDENDRDPTVRELAEIAAEWPDALVNAELTQVQAMSELAEHPDSLAARRWLHVCSIWTDIVRENHQRLAVAGTDAAVLDLTATRVREVSAA